VISPRPNATANQFVNGTTWPREIFYFLNEVVKVLSFKKKDKKSEAKLSTKQQMPGFVLDLSCTLMVIRALEKPR
jgi:hypothetical protein